MRKTLPLTLTLLSLAGTCWALEKETSLVTGKKVGQLAVAGRLLIDVHAEFMMSRTFDKDTVLHWYNMGVSGGGAFNKESGGSFGDFGLHVPNPQRDDKYPHAALIGDVPAAKFDGGDIMKGNFVIDAPAADRRDLAIEVWVHRENPELGEVIFGWQSEDGKAFQSADGKTIVIESENFMRNVPGSGAAEGRKWELTTDKPGCSGKGMM